jgi:hypothetical protein
MVAHPHRVCPPGAAQRRLAWFHDAIHKASTHGAGPKRRVISVITSARASAGSGIRMDTPYVVQPSAEVNAIRPREVPPARMALCGESRAVLGAIRPFWADRSGSQGDHVAIFSPIGRGETVEASHPPGSRQIDADSGLGLRCGTIGLCPVQDASSGAHTDAYDKARAAAGGRSPPSRLIPPTRIGARGRDFGSAARSLSSARLPLCLQTAGSTFLGRLAIFSGWRQGGAAGLLSPSSPEPSP